MWCAAQIDSIRQTFEAFKAKSVRTAALFFPRPIEPWVDRDSCIPAGKTRSILSIRPSSRPSN